MSGWLLDTDVLSAFAPGKRVVPPDVLAWFEDRSDTLYLSAITAAEIAAGIAKLRRRGGTSRADALTSWFERILDLYGECMLPFDVGAARLAGKLGDAAIGQGRHPGFADVAIAGIAASRNLTVATVNLRHFQAIGVAAVNPFEIEATLPVAGEEHGGD